MANKTTGKSKESHYATYKSSKRWETNRLKRLERTVRNQPNNEQAKTALKSGVVYRRQVPKVRTWSASWVRVAKLFKEFSGSFDPSIMSSNPKIASEALQKPGRKTLEVAKQKVTKTANVDFTLGARLQGNR